LNKILAEFLYTSRSHAQAKLLELEENAKHPKDGSLHKDVQRAESRRENENILNARTHVELINKTIEVAWDSIGNPIKEQ